MRNDDGCPRTPHTTPTLRYSPPTVQCAPSPTPAPPRTSSPAAVVLERRTPRQPFTTRLQLCNVLLRRRQRPLVRLRRLHRLCFMSLPRREIRCSSDSSAAVQLFSALPSLANRTARSNRRDRMRSNAESATHGGIFKSFHRPDSYCCCFCSCGRCCCCCWSPRYRTVSPHRTGRRYPCTLAASHTRALANRASRCAIAVVAAPSLRYCRGRLALPLRVDGLSESPLPYDSSACAPLGALSHLSRVPTRCRRFRFSCSRRATPPHPTLVNATVG